jgi:hypothetical protein
MNKYLNITFEIILLISGVFVFRSLWIIMDNIPLFNKTYVHILLLILGLLLSVFAIHKLSIIK